MMNDRENTWTAATARSPLWMVTQEPLLNEFVGSLTALLQQLRAPTGEREHRLEFSRQQLADVRQAFSSMIVRGEEALHQLCELFCRQFFTGYQLSSVVIGEIDATKERFVLSQGLSPKDLYSTSDIDLGTRQLAKLRFIDRGVWSNASLVANYVEYQPTESNALHIHKLISRIKAEEEIWNKVVDEIFDLDGLVRRDKQMSHLSWFVKDVFGIKIVVDGKADVAAMHRVLVETRWEEALITGLGLQPSPDVLRLEHLETKDYSGGDGRKSSGWSAIKSVVRWGGKTFEIQTQSLRNYFSEQEFLTQESHAGFKSKREALRDEIARQEPLFGFYRALLKWLFIGDGSVESAPQYPGVKVRLK
ncbi:MAG: hypothetical protein NTZ90_16310 [Proteobacteria bacterium]|nr:hypothetical protein [Pseudomonadota bacterium]